MKIKDTLREANRAPLNPPPLWLAKLRHKVDSFFEEVKQPLPKLFRRKH